jgi:hypothetical protein
MPCFAVFRVAQFLCHLTDFLRCFGPIAEATFPGLCIPSCTLHSSYRATRQCCHRPHFVTRAFVRRLKSEPTFGCRAENNTTVALLVTHSPLVVQFSEPWSQVQFSRRTLIDDDLQLRRDLLESCVYKVRWSVFQVSYIIPVEAHNHQTLRREFPLASHQGFSPFSHSGQAYTRPTRSIT